MKLDTQFGGRVPTSQSMSSGWSRTLLSTRNLLFAVVVVAVSLRLASALFQGNTVVELPGVYDQLSYHELAQRVVGGYGFSFGEGHWPATPAGEPTAHWSYLYTLYLAGIYALFGVQPLAARAIQAVIVGVFHTVLIWRIGRRTFGPEVGLLAAAFSACYVYLFYYAGGLLTESFYFVGILWTIDVAQRIVEDRPPRQHRGWLIAAAPWLELGLAIGVTGLLRQLYLLFVPFLFLWIWWNRAAPPNQEGGRVARHLRPHALAGLAVATVVVVALIAPWSMRNYRVFGTLTPLNTNAGFAFFWGNHPIHGTSFIPILEPKIYLDLIPEELLVLNEAELDRALLQQGIGFVTEDPVRYILLSISRTREYFKFWPSAQSGMVSNLSRVASFALFLPFMLYGLWRSFGLWRRPQHAQQRAQLALLYLFVIVYTGIHLATWTLIRYRLPVDTIMLLFAALAVTTLLRHFRLLSPSEGSPE